MICKVCGGDWPDVAFTTRGHSKCRVTHSSTKRQSVCKRCRELLQKAKRNDDPFIPKASRSIRRHGDKFVKLGYASSLEEFINKYGWFAERVAHDMKHAHSNGCPYCEKPFAQMLHGLQDLTLDIIDPEKEPYYTTNVKVVCHTCNMAKQRTPPDKWAQYLLYHKDWERRQARIRTDPLLGTLFEGSLIKEWGTARSLL